MTIQRRSDFTLLWGRLPDVIGLSTSDCLQCVISTITLRCLYCDVNTRVYCNVRGATVTSNCLRYDLIVISFEMNVWRLAFMTLVDKIVKWRFLLTILSTKVITFNVPPRLLVTTALLISFPVKPLWCDDLTEELNMWNQYVGHALNILATIWIMIDVPDWQFGKVYFHWKPRPQILTARCNVTPVKALSTVRRAEFPRFAERNRWQTSRLSPATITTNRLLRVNECTCKWLILTHGWEKETNLSSGVTQ